MILIAGRLTQASRDHARGCYLTPTHSHSGSCPASPGEPGSGCDSRDRGNGGKDRIVKIGHQTARSLDRYLRARARHAQAWRPQL